MKIGYSVSFCIRDIIDGNVQERDVLKIIGNTRAHTLADWEGVVQIYRHTAWRDNPELGEAILWRLVADEKIEQPRCFGDEPLLRQRMRDADPNPYWEEV